MSAVTQVLVHGCHDCPFKETLRRQDGGQPTFCRLANFPKLSIDQYVAGTVPAPECALRDDAEIHVRLAAAADVAVAPVAGHVHLSPADPALKQALLTLEACRTIARAGHAPPVALAKLFVALGLVTADEMRGLAAEELQRRGEEP